MSFPQLGYPQYLSASQAVYGSERPGVLTPSSRGGSTEIGGSPSATAAAVTSVLGMYANPYAHNYSAFLPYTSADLALFSQMGSQYELKDSPGVHPASFAAHTSPAFYPYGQFQYGDPARPKNATRESTSTLKAWLNEHRKNPYPTKGEKIMLAIITKMTLTQVSTWFANARRRLKKENKVTWGSRSKEDEDGNLLGSGDEAEKNEDEEEIDLESIDIDKIDDNDGDQSNEDDDDKSSEGSRDRRGGLGATGELDNLEKRRAFALQAHEAFEKSKNAISIHPGSKENSDSSNNNTTRVLSPDRPGSFPLPSNNKPKIWSLAETATSPDSSSQKPTSPCGTGATTHPSAPHHQIQTHPAFLPSHGLYTCQIGKFHNWTNGAFLGQNSLLNVRSFLGVNQHHHHQHNHHLPAQQQQQPTSVVVSPVAASAALTNDSKAQPESHSPKHIDHENGVRSDSPPTQTLKSSFRPIHDRSSLPSSARSPQDATQRVLTALSSA
ncbi:iroquois-class homeodomain protein IRX-1a [Pundamilia nyererei]|uniref:Iroquois-class homeodomain protein irx-1-like n=3 Tax=Haplochromini TaxID=319058 RepID=A0A3B4FMF3_9CICH|nr:iroquois-class homeodomain protein irx-1 [Maylandia zebra]XP_005744673.1 PREDICTED: iroquois-class homeodomain protein irx-1-like [Pundamilia nyererei]XP_005936084.1 iroquois-class homeodomain protein IRX-1a [Haplochromis burtoni]